MTAIDIPLALIIASLLIAIKSTISNHKKKLASCTRRLHEISSHLEITHAANVRMVADYNRALREIESLKRQLAGYEQSAKACCVASMNHSRLQNFEA